MNHKHFLRYTRCTLLDIHAEIHTKKVGNERKFIVFEVLVVSSNTVSNRESNLRKHSFCPTVNIFYTFALWFSAKILQDHIWLQVKHQVRPATLFRDPCLLFQALQNYAFT